MRITALHRWHWMVIGLAAGLLCGGARSASMNFADELAGYGERIGQRDFERAIVTQLHGRPQFTDLVVYPYRLSGASAGNLQVHVVSGLYCDGQPREEDGRLALQWTPAYFVASVPFRPVGPAAADGKPPQGAPPPAFDNVLGYLRSLEKSGPSGPPGVRFRYASWWWLTRPLFVWTCGGFLLVGVVWPTVLNLLAFGRLTRPPEPKGVSLLGVTTKSTAPAAAAPPAPSGLDEASLRDLDRELEAALAEASPAPGAVAAPAAPPRKLAAESLPAVAVPAGPGRDFGAGREDYYPTELGAKHDPHGAEGAKGR